MPPGMTRLPALPGCDRRYKVMKLRAMLTLWPAREYLRQFHDPDLLVFMGRRRGLAL